MAEDQRNFQKLVEAALSCPSCRDYLQKKESILLCSAGNHGPFKIDEEGRYHLLGQSAAVQYETEHQTGVNRLKSLLKRVPGLYYVAWNIFCPVLVSRRGLCKLSKLLPENALVINLGSGPRRIRKNWINVDVVPFEHVDIVADAAYLPFRDNSVDAIVNESLFEHVAHPALVAREVERVLKPGGILYTSVPFLTPYHASPDDFTRWTKSGLEKHFSGLSKVADGVDAGPWSALLVFLAYWLGVIFSFGSRRYAPTLAFFFMIILGPLKIFDFIFSRMPGAEAVAAQLYFIGRKPK